MSAPPDALKLRKGGWPLVRALLLATLLVVLCVPLGLLVLTLLDGEPATLSDWVTMAPGLLLVAWGGLLKGLRRPVFLTLDEEGLTDTSSGVAIHLRWEDVVNVELVSRFAGTQHLHFLGVELREAARASLWEQRTLLNCRGRAGCAHHYIDLNGSRRDPEEILELVEDRFEPYRLARFRAERQALESRE